MNMVRELRIKKGIQAKQLAIEIGVSTATVSDWEHQRKNPTGERLKKLAEYFAVDEGFVLGYGMDKPNLFVPEDPKVCGQSETEQIIKRLLDHLENQPRSEESRIISEKMDQLPKDQRKQLLDVFRAMHPDMFMEESDDT